MTEVEFIAQYRPGKTAAEFVRPLPAGSIQYTIQPDTLTGYVGRTIRCLNPEQNEYCGFIYETADISHNANQKPDLTYSAKYPFTMISLAKANEYVYEDDPVTFQLSVLSDGKKVAVNVNPVREKYTVSISFKNSNLTCR